MFDIFVYLFENYFHAEARPAPRQLARKLSAAGFEDEDITEALDWLSGLERVAGTGRPLIAANNRSIRCYAGVEAVKLSAECRGFLYFLESAGVLNAPLREIIIERAMALRGSSVGLSKLKVIVLMVLWSQQQTMDTLILEELLSEEENSLLH